MMDLIAYRDYDDFVRRVRRTIPARHDMAAAAERSLVH